ncbi:succinate dehydrogenase, hydrophobic membrane anchor protein [Ferruginivarius sediminum]|jgi:succinate dehydrogenase / fumarate reductase membrane anchor subunit|uniref:Succinate dehydrogenase hydrophobic membrane anchor subunit n=1 Tax=Ferruginivarius sediminum TaxID=2661937 RepID=A0A369T738_9PROT|nr:succinate dehydrogenase, hydrophobic membrane anchor protein [Ferruginivarius sediminum]RDD61143.1 succinate dehydrogenase, hydrophobic membrane anchor protein [Ferruginivarius sediminum]
MKSMRTPMARVRGLGSAKDGTAHWWAQRLSALALIPLTVWFVASVIAMAGADHAAMTAWVSSPVVAGLLVLLVVATFYHGYLGLQVVVEDYVHHEGAKFATIIALKALAIVLGLAGTLSVLTILFRG